jgi:hypothetical protein
MRVRCKHCGNDFLEDSGQSSHAAFHSAVALEGGAEAQAPDGHERGVHEGRDRVRAGLRVWTPRLRWQWAFKVIRKIARLRRIFWATGLHLRDFKTIKPDQRVQV